MPAKNIDLQWPFGGLDESQAFSRQRGGQSKYTTASCKNVVGFDPATGRNRGAARCGLTKYTTGRVNGASGGQCLVSVSGSPEIDTRVTESGELLLTEGGEARDVESGSPVTVGSRTTTLVGIAGGTAAKITTGGVTAIDGGSTAFSALPSFISGVSFFNDLFFCDGANYWYYDVSANLLAPWTAVDGTMPQQTAESLNITGASNASPIVITIANHGYSTGEQVTIADVLGNTAANGSWTITVLTSSTFSLNGSTGSGAYTSGGTCVVRRVGSRCSIMAVWGGRMVLSGLATDPNNVFMSAVGDPYDWNYSPDVQTVQQAVAGNVTSGYGKNIDIVTALIPYTDDILLIGGTHSIRKFLGNPAEGGLNVSVTDITGIASNTAWCQSPEGIIYFFGSRGGVYRMSPDGIPSRLTSTTIDERLADIDLNNTVVTLLWDDRAIAVRVYITPTNGTGTLHFVWDVRNEAWWPFSYSNALTNPWAVHLLSGGSAAERYILEYGQDGYVRYVDVGATSDDGQPIESFVYLGPFSNVMLQEITAIMSEESAQVSWAVCTAESLEKALEAVPRSSGRFKSGRNAHCWPRAFIEEGYLRLSATGPMAVDRITAAMEQVSETARRTMRTIR